MPKKPATEALYVAFHPNSEVVRDIDTTAHDTAYLSAPFGATSRLALRYALTNSVVVDRYPGKSDEEVLAAVAAAAAVAADVVAAAITTTATPEE